MLRNLLLSGLVGGAALLGVFMVIAEIVEGGRMNHAVGLLLLLVVLINPLFWVFGGAAFMLAIWLFPAAQKRSVDRR